MMAEKMTIRDIAQLVGVSSATVSRVLNNKPDVDPQTRERILRTIQAYGFIPDLAATRLAAARIGGKNAELSSFPADFLWGASTSAYQVEGATAEDGRGPCIWDDFATRPGTIFQDNTADIAADHYHRMPEDVELMTALRLNAYRFSFSWSRILPTGRGKVNQPGLDFYDRLVDALLEHNITPVATLYHWDLPLALHQSGGWIRRETADAFVEYTEVLARRLGDRIPWWITQNEPWCIAYLGYGVGTHAPGICDKQATIDVAHHVLLAHGWSTRCLREYLPSTGKVGIALNLMAVSAADSRPETLAAVEQADMFYNRWFLDPIFKGAYPEHLFQNLGGGPPPIEEHDLEAISVPLDFVGINYYSRAMVRANSQGQTDNMTRYEQVIPVPEATYTGMAWEIYPQGLEELLLRLHREYAPPCILITENGAAFEEQWDGRNHVPDKKRVQYLSDHLVVLERCLKRGVPLAGYFIWSLLDNFEWAEGYSKRFGLVYVDYKSQRRVIKESGRWYAAFIAAQDQNRSPA